MTKGCGQTPSQKALIRASTFGNFRRHLIRTTFTKCRSPKRQIGRLSSLHGSTTQIMVPGFGGFLRIPFLQIFSITEKLISPNLKSTLHHSLISGQSRSTSFELQRFLLVFKQQNTLYLLTSKCRARVLDIHPSGLRRFLPFYTAT